MTKWSLAPVLLLVFFGTVALAQSIYQWKDETGRWHFSDSSPPGVTAKKVMKGTPKPESVPATLRTQLADSLSAGSESDEQAVSKLPTARSSNVSADSSDPRWLLILPPNTQARTDNSKPFSGWTPAQFFDSAEACKHYRYMRSDVGDWQLLDSNCIPAAKFITGKEADVIMVVTQFEPVAVGFNTYLLSGKVFNRGQATARNVVAKYQIRHATGALIMQGEVSTSPGEIPELTFAEFRTPSIGGWVLNGSSAQAEADWSKK